MYNFKDEKAKEPTVEEFIRILQEVNNSYQEASKENFLQKSCQAIDKSSNKLYRFMNQISLTSQGKNFFIFDKKQKNFLNEVLFNLCRVRYPNYHIINILVNLGADINHKEEEDEKRLDKNAIYIKTLRNDNSKSYFSGLVYANPLEVIFGELLLESQGTMLSESTSSEVDFGQGSRWMFPLFLMLKGADPSKVNLDYFACYLLEIPFNFKKNKTKVPYDEKKLLNGFLNSEIGTLFFILKDLKDDKKEKAHVLSDLKEAILDINISQKEAYYLASYDTKNDIKNTLLLLKKKGYKNAIKNPLINTLLKLDNSKEFESNEDKKLIALFRRGNYFKIEEAVKNTIQKYNIRYASKHILVSPKIEDNQEEKLDLFKLKNDFFISEEPYNFWENLEGTVKKKLLKLANAYNWLLEAIRNNNYKLVDVLVDHLPVDVNNSDSIILAICANNWELAEKLLSKLTVFDIKDLGFLLNKQKEGVNKSQDLIYKLIFTSNINLDGDVGVMWAKHSVWESEKSYKNIAIQWFIEAIDTSNESAIKRLFIIGAISKKDIKNLPEKYTQKLQELVNKKNSTLLNDYGLVKVLDDLNFKKRFFSNPTENFDKQDLQNLREKAHKEGWLVDAIKNQNKTLIDALVINLEVNVNEEHPDGGRTPLIEAALHTPHEWAQEVCQLLIQYRANVNYARKTDGFTPLCSAIKSTNNQLIDLLIGFGANINANINTNINKTLNRVPQTPFDVIYCRKGFQVLGVHENREKVLSYQIIFNPNVKILHKSQDKWVQRNLLNLAQKNNWLEDAIKRYKEEIKKTDKPKSYYAIKNLFTSGAVTENDIVKLDQELIDMIINMAEVNAWYEFSIEQNDKTLANILENSLKVYHPRHNNFSNIQELISLLDSNDPESNNLEQAQILINNNFNIVNQYVGKGMTLLHRAIQDNFPEKSIKFLLKNKADLNAKNSQGETPFDLLKNNKNYRKKLKNIKALLTPYPDWRKSDYNEIISRIYHLFVGENFERDCQIKIETRGVLLPKNHLILSNKDHPLHKFVKEFTAIKNEKRMYILSPNNLKEICLNKEKYNNLKQEVNDYQKKYLSNSKELFPGTKLQVSIPNHGSDLTAISAPKDDNLLSNKDNEEKSLRKVDLQDIENKEQNDKVGVIGDLKGLNKEERSLNNPVSQKIKSDFTEVISNFSRHPQVENNVKGGGQYKIEIEQTINNCRDRLEEIQNYIENNIWKVGFGGVLLNPNKNDNKKVPHRVKEIYDKIVQWKQEKNDPNLSMPVGMWATYVQIKKIATVALEQSSLSRRFFRSKDTKNFYDCVKNNKSLEKGNLNHESDDSLSEKKTFNLK